MPFSDISFQFYYEQRSEKKKVRSIVFWAVETKHLTFYCVLNAQNIVHSAIILLILELELLD